MTQGSEVGVGLGALGCGGESEVGWGCWHGVGVRDRWIPVGCDEKTGEVLISTWILYTTQHTARSRPQVTCLG